MQTSYVLLIGRINESGRSSVATRNNSATILVPFLCRELGLLISPFPLYISPCNRGYVKYRVANWQQHHLHTLLSSEPRCKGPFASAHSVVKGVWRKALISSQYHLIDAKIVQCIRESQAHCGPSLPWLQREGPQLLKLQPTATFFGNLWKF